MKAYYFPRTMPKTVIAFPPLGDLPAADTVRLFIEALSKNCLEEAKAYLSKDYVHDFDLPALSAYFSENYKYKRLQKAQTDTRPKHYITDSILVKENNKSSIIHLHMIKEFGRWKIYDIDKE